MPCMRVIRATGKSTTYFCEDCVLLVEMLHVIPPHGKEELRAIRVGHAHIRHRQQPSLGVLSTCRQNLVFEEPVRANQIEKEIGQ